MGFPGIVSLSIKKIFLIGNILWLISLISSLFEQSMAFVCHSCCKSFTSAENLRPHKAVHDETKELCFAENLGDCRPAGALSAIFQG